jgi:hypothetical protein
MEPLRIRTSRPLAAALLSAALLAGSTAACGRSPSGIDEQSPVGSVRFSYSGGRSGTFEATGELQVAPGGVPQGGTGAAALQAGDLLSAIAVRSADAGRADVFGMIMGAVTGRGTLQFDPLACQEDAAGCRVAAFAPDLDASELAAITDLADLTALAERAWIVAVGSVTVTSLTGRRVRGTFQGIAVRAGGQALQDVLTISNGTFDLPVRAQ